jgi:UDP-N-acetylglucosamine transferase subunit ALG13
MIFVTVGAQMPFDRLVRNVDAWVGRSGGNDVFAQIGRTDWRPANMGWTAFLDPPEYRQRLFAADVIVTHAGMGTILTALEFGRPILVMPRRGDLNETRNDHQFGTARALAEAGRVSVAWNERDLYAALSRLDSIPEPKRVASHASYQLLTVLRQFIRQEATSPASEPIMPAADPAPTVGFIGPEQPQIGRRAA